MIVRPSFTHHRSEKKEVFTAPAQHVPSVVTEDNNLCGSILYHDALCVAMIVKIGSHEILIHIRVCCTYVAHTYSHICCGFAAVNASLVYMAWPQVAPEWHKLMWARQLAEAFAAPAQALIGPQG